MRPWSVYIRGGIDLRAEAEGYGTQEQAAVPLITLSVVVDIVWRTNTRRPPTSPKLVIMEPPVQMASLVTTS